LNLDNAFLNILNIFLEDNLQHINKINLNFFNKE